MPKQDIEAVLQGVATFLTGNLNSQISTLNAEKNDGITLKPVPVTSYHFQYPGDRTDLGDPFLIYEEAEDPVIQNQGGLFATVHYVGIHIVLADNGTDPNIVTKLFRYRRVLKDLVIANWATIIGSNKFSVKCYSPSPPFKDQNSAFVGRVVGIVLSVPIAD